jgi:hypothetical protein
VEYQGYLLLADITGYTLYLTRSELEHAQGTLTDLLELLIENTRPPLVVSQLEGDAVFSYGLHEGFVTAQTFVEMVEDTYVAFRRTIDLMVLNNTCLCNACANVSSLDLKFFVHHGSFALQQLGEREQLVGSDVNLIHRLLKNTVTASTGLTAYVLCTDAAVEALQLADGAAAAMTRHVETVADFGPVVVWVKDMHPVFDARRDEEQLTYDDDEILGSVETEVAMRPELVWDYLNQSDFRNVLIGSDSLDILDRRDGRIGPGSVYQCYHGSRVFPQVVLEWRPFDRVVVQQMLPLPGRPAYVLMDFHLQPTEGGTCLRQTVAQPTGPRLKRMAARAMMRMMGGRALADLERFRDRIQQDLAATTSARSSLHPLPRTAVAAAAAVALGRTEAEDR